MPSPKTSALSLESNDRLSLSVQDDGIGMAAQPTENHGGLGLRIMRNRAAIIGATLTIQPAEPRHPGNVRFVEEEP